MSVHVLIKQREFEEAVAKTNMTYQELAGLLEINRIYLSNIKNERYPEFRPSPKLRWRIMDILNVKFDDVFRTVRVSKKPKPEAQPAPKAAKAGPEPNGSPEGAQGALPEPGNDQEPRTAHANISN